MECPSHRLSVLVPPDEQNIPPNGRNSRSGVYTCNNLDAGGTYIVHNHVHVQYIHDCMSLLKEE